MNVTAETFQNAIEFAVKAHKGVYRKGDKKPYIAHPIAVMSRLFSVKESSNMYLLGTVAVLHDTVEDVEWVTLDVIADLFGHYVAALVQELTLDKEQYKVMGKKEYLAHEMTRMSSYAFVIKLCDRLENVIDMKKMGVKFQTRYTEETYYILNEVEKNRKKITNTQQVLIQMLYAELANYKHLLDASKVQSETQR